MYSAIAQLIGLVGVCSKAIIFSNSITYLFSEGMSKASVFSNSTIFMLDEGMFYG